MAFLLRCKGGTWIEKTHGILCDKKGAIYAEWGAVIMAPDH